MHIRSSYGPPTGQYGLTVDHTYSPLPDGLDLCIFVLTQAGFRCKQYVSPAQSHDAVSNTICKVVSRVQLACHLADADATQRSSTAADFALLHHQYRRPFTGLVPISTSKVCRVVQFQLKHSPANILSWPGSLLQKRIRYVELLLLPEH
jgi:hypothetical protein